MTRKGYTLFFYYWGPVILYCLAIFINSCFPVPEAIQQFSISDKAMHAIAYALLGALFSRAYRRTWRHGNNATLVFFLGAVSAGAYGISDELHQILTPSRTGDAMDALADVIGGAAGAGAYVLAAVKFDNASTG